MNVNQKMHGKCTIGIWVITNINKVSTLTHTQSRCLVGITQLRSKFNLVFINVKECLPLE